MFVQVEDRTQTGSAVARRFVFTRLATLSSRSKSHSACRSFATRRSSDTRRSSNTVTVTVAVSTGVINADDAAVMTATLADVVSYMSITTALSIWARGYKAFWSSFSCSSGVFTPNLVNRRAPTKFAYFEHDSVLDSRFRLQTNLRLQNGGYKTFRDRFHARIGV